MAKHNRFLEQPNVRISRSLFDLSCDWSGTLSVGTLYPMLVKEVLPGDTFKAGSDLVIRLTSNFQKPLFADLCADVYYFYVPNRLAFKDSDKVFGNSEPTEYISPVLFSYPVVPSSGKAVYPGSIADNMGLPPFTEFGIGPSDGVLTPDITLLPFRDFALIWNNWFRDENSVGSVYVQSGAANSSEALNGGSWSSVNYTGMCPPVSKVHDYFTSCLPKPQKGDVVDIYPSQIAPLDAVARTHTFTGTPILTFNTALVNGSNYTLGYTGTAAANSGLLKGFGNVPSGNTNVINGTNLGAVVPALDVSTFRFQMAYQQFLERLARGGSRYTEFINSMFGVTSPDARLMIPEYLGGRRIPLNVQQVAQTSPGLDGDGVGKLQGYSLTVGSARMNKAFVEHGFIIGVICIRQRKHIYQQGVERFWTRKARNDYYNPIFAHISEQPVMSTELFGTASATDVFGFNEAWADYRFGVSHVVGQLRSQVSGYTGGVSLDMWHLADFYANKPVLSSSFLNETRGNLDRAIVNESVDQFIVNIHHDIKAIRPMPVYGTPKGL